MGQPYRHSSNMFKYSNVLVRPAFARYGGGRVGGILFFMKLWFRLLYKKYLCFSIFAIFRGVVSFWDNLYLTSALQITVFEEKKTDKGKF